MNSTTATTTTSCTRAYIEMMRRGRGDRRCRKCGWFGHLAHYYRQIKIMTERRKKSEGGGNKFAPLLSKVCRRMEKGNAVHPYEGKAQPTKCWGCGEVGHVLWGCLNKAAQPRKAEAQHERKVEKRKYRECGGDNHWEQKCPLVRLWREGWRLKRGWHEGKERAIRRGVLVERCERGWME